MEERLVSEDQDRITFGTSETAHQVLKALALEGEEGVFSSMMDAYRFAIALGLAIGKQTQLANRRTVFNVGSLDKDHSLANLITTLRPEVQADSVYRAAEEFAETGLAAMAPSVSLGEFRFTDMLELAKSHSQVEP